MSSRVSWAWFPTFMKMTPLFGARSASFGLNALALVTLCFLERLDEVRVLRSPAVVQRGGLSHIPVPQRSLAAVEVPQAIVRKRRARPRRRLSGSSEHDRA